MRRLIKSLPVQILVLKGQEHPNLNLSHNQKLQLVIRRPEHRTARSPSNILLTGRFSLRYMSAWNCIPNSAPETGGLAFRRQSSYPNSTAAPHTSYTTK